MLRASARRLPPAAPTPSASRPYRGEVELVLELLVADGREEGVVREVRLPVVPREVTDAPTVAASGEEEEEEEELQKEAAAAPSGRHRRWWGCCQAATHTIALHAPPAHADEDQEEEEAVGLVLLLAFADDRAASHFMDYVFYLQTVAPPVPANEDGQPGGEEEEEEEEEAAEREDYDEKYTFTQTEYWECFHEETGQECFEWYSAEELQRHSILRVLGRFFVPALAAAAAAATPVYRVLDVGAGTSELPFNLYEALSAESKRIGRPFRVELWSVDFARTAVEFLRGQKWIRHAQLREKCPPPASEDCAQMRADVEGGWPCVEVFQRVMDATNLSFFPDHYFDMVTEKGCLDCFVNGTGRALVPTYFQQIKRVLRPDGHFLMITVSNIDLPLILQTGGEVAQKAVFRKNLVEPHLGPDEIIAARQLHCRAPGRFVVEAIRAKTERHAVLCRPATLDDEADAGTEAEKTVVCDECERRYPAASTPKRCGTCSTLLQRFIVGG